MMISEESLPIITTEPTAVFDHGFYILLAEKEHETNENQQAPSSAVEMTTEFGARLSPL